MDLPIPVRRPLNKGKRICPLVDFAFPADHKVKILENKKFDK